MSSCAHVSDASSPLLKQNIVSDFRFRLREPLNLPFESLSKLSAVAPAMGTTSPSDVWRPISSPNMSPGSSDDVVDIFGSEMVDPDALVLPAPGKWLARGYSDDRGFSGISLGSLFS